MPKIPITIKISEDCYSAWKLLKSKNVNPAKFFREGGEQKVIETAKRYKFTLKKYKLPF
jgi:hypothetical protein